MKKAFAGAVLLAAVLSVTLSGCNRGGSASGSGSGELPLLEYSVDIGYSQPATTLDLSTDIVTPYLEKKFRIRVGEVTQNATQQISFRQRLGAMVAAGNMPDVIIAGTENIAYAVSTGKYGDIDEQVNRMTNLNKYMDQKMWPRFMIGGKKVQIPSVAVNTSIEPYVSDPYNMPYSVWTLWTREDILAKCGYTFTPLAEIEREYTSQGKVPPVELFDITPPIDSPEAFMTYLRKIKALNLTVNDAPIIPLSGVGWNQFHIGSMFDSGHWRYRDGSVDGFLGGTGVYEYYKWLNRAYQEGLMDPDFISQKDDQIQQKIATGRVVSGMYAVDLPGANKALTDADPAQRIRYIPWPKQHPYWGKFDIFEGGFWRVTVRNDFKDKDRLIEYFDWFFSDEGLDILTWGPEEAGLWEINAAGKKVFKDESIKQDFLTGAAGRRGADYYGLWNYRSIYFPFQSRAAICAPTLGGYNPYAYERSYDPVIDIDLLSRSYFGLTGMDFAGNYSYGDNSNDVAKINNWYWSRWTGELCAGVLTAPTNAAFERAWAEAYAAFESETDYQHARELMAAWFRENGSTGRAP
jgi:ABC-type glycerol-3-phosphate transport system substrate-binding protein